MVRSFPAARFARKLLLVPVLAFALLVVLVEATAAPPAGKGWNSPTHTSAYGLTDKPSFGGDGRRMR